MAEDFLFVYGTLMRGQSDADIYHRFQEAATFVGEATVLGQLYLIDWYPGLVLDPAGGPVHGELYRLPEGGDLLAALDTYECIGPDFPQPQEYKRLRHEVGSGGKAWIYAYQWSVTGKDLISGGRFEAKLTPPR